MLFVLWFKWRPECASKLLDLWKDFKYPEEVKLIGRYVLIGRHVSLAIFDAPDAESILKIAFPFKELGIAHIAPAMPFDEVIEKIKKM